MKKLIFLTPVFNDWDNLNILIQKIEKNIEKFNFLFELIIVNDCSSQIKKVKFNQKKIHIMLAVVLSYANSINYWIPQIHARLNNISYLGNNLYESSFKYFKTFRT